MSSSPPVTDPRLLLERRIELYNTVGFTPDFGDVVIPDLPPEFAWPIPVLKGMAQNYAFALCGSRSPSWRWVQDLNRAVKHHDRSASERSYIVWVRRRFEADKKLKNLSANQLRELGMNGITLTERLLLGWFHHHETSSHLDVKGETFCSGSRSRGGYVPVVDWMNGMLRVYLAHPDRPDSNQRAYEVVSTSA